MVRITMFCLAAAALLVAGGVAPAQESSRPGRHSLTVHRHRAPPGVRGVASPLDIPVGDGVYFRTPFQVVAAGGRPVILRIPHYQGPDGTYDSQADFIRSINGTPCGQACTARSLERWGYAPAD